MDDSGLHKKMTEFHCGLHGIVKYRRDSCLIIMWEDGAVLIHLCILEATDVHHLRCGTA
jgi:hypothetical protein